MMECALCHDASGAQSRLAIEGSGTIEIALCKSCRNDLAAESWIECTDVAETETAEV